VSDINPNRLFIALALPAVVKLELARVQRELRDVLPPHAASWTKPDSMHLTLRFLGDVDVGRVSELEQSFRAAVTGFGELDLLCERLGCFPGLRFPRVVWAWVHDPEEKLLVLAQRVNEAVAPFAERPAENELTGHITLARHKQIKRAGSEPLAKFVEGAATRRFGQWRASEVELIRSELLPLGSRYTTLATVSLLQPKA
jgi:2'-5' RNA ligase